MCWFLKRTILIVAGASFQGAGASVDQKRKTASNRWVKKKISDHHELCQIVYVDEHCVCKLNRLYSGDCIIYWTLVNLLQKLHNTVTFNKRAFGKVEDPVQKKQDAFTILLLG